MDSIKQNKQGLRVLVMGTALQLFLGIIYVWSVFVKPVSETYGWDLAATKLTTSFMLSFFVLGILGGGRLLEKLGPSKVVLMGGLMLAAGMLATAFVPSSTPGLIYFTYGIVGGFGVGAAYNTIITAAQKWFPQNRGFATGVSVCAFGFSTVVFAPLVEWLVRLFTVRNTFLILAAVFLLMVLLTFRAIQFPAEQPAAAKAGAAQGLGKQYTTREMLGKKEFYFITFSLMMLTSSFFILNPSLKTLALEKGLDPAIGTVLVMITGVANAAGRLAVPFLSDKVGREQAALSIIVVTALCTAALSVVQGGLFLVAVALIAFCYGGSSGIYPVITADHFGVKNVGSNYGAVMMGFALSALTFPMLIGQIPEMVTRFLVLASMSVLGAVLILLLIRSKKQEQK